MKTITIGVMTEKKLRQRILDIAAGRVKPKRGEPKVWFHSMKSLAEVLSDSNRKLLKVIADMHPETIKELADLTGRQPSNLSRTLKKFEQYGFIEMQQLQRAKRPIAKVTQFDIRLSA